MTTTDPIGNMLTSIRNAAQVEKEQVTLPYSKLKEAIAGALLRAGFIAGVSKRGKGVKKRLIITLAYTEAGDSKINTIERVSKPSRRIYRAVREIRPLRGGTGVTILSTPNGVLSDEEAREQTVGGEPLCKVW